MPHKPLDEMTLRELGHERDVLDVFLAQQEGEVDVELDNLMDKLQGTREQKVERWGRYLLRQEAKMEAITTEERRLGDRKAIIKRAYEASKAALKFEMERQGITKVRGDLCDVAIQLNNPAIAIDETIITEFELEQWTEIGSRAGFVRVKPAVVELDKKAVLAASKTEGFVLPPGLSIVRTSSVRIK